MSTLLSEPLLVKPQQMHLFDRTPLILQSGRTLGPITVAYETYGQLNAAHDNAVLICHALTGDAHVAGRHAPTDRKPGWWDELVGPGKAVDTDRYFVICSNVLGGCQGTTGPSSINPATGQPYALTFPTITTRDMVSVQAAMLDRLGIERLHSVIGGSLGAMQALEWAVTYPERVGSVIPMAGASRFHPQGIAFNEVQRQAIIADPNFQGGQYYGTPGPVAGLATARMLGMITYRSDASMWQQFGREVRPDAQSSGELDRGMSITYQVESYLHHQGESLVKRFDANSYLYLSRAMDLHDISRGHGTLAAAHARITAPTLVVAVRSDLLFPPYLQQETYQGIVQGGGRAAYLELDSDWGHDSFLVDIPMLAPAVRTFLAHPDQLLD